MGMLIGFNRPIIEDPFAWSLTSSTSCSFVNSSAYLTDDSIPSATRITWANSEVSEDAYLQLNATMASQSIRVGGLMGVTLPVGTRVQFVRHLGITIFILGEGYVTLLPDGSRAVWFAMAASITSVTSLGFRIMSFNGTDFLPHPITFDIGEAWFSDAYEYPILATKKLKILNDGTVRRSTNGQPFPLLRRDYRQIVVDLTPQFYSKAYSSSDPSSWANLRGSLAKANTCVAVPWYRDTNGTVSYQVATEQALFGWCSNRGEIDRRNDAPMYNLSLQFDEYPPSTV